MTQEGIRRVLRLAGGVLMILVLLQPVVRMDLGDLRFPGRAAAGGGGSGGGIRRQQEAALETGIEEELASYIWDKAQALGLSARCASLWRQARTASRYPARHRDRGYSEDLSEIIETDLGIPGNNRTGRRRHSGAGKRGKAKMAGPDRVL